ncbi:MAG: hypothetical protein JXB62_09580 [Pirellulales bacterium]|nr:hypothetical protein [Pirellulales bacterium]
MGYRRRYVPEQTLLANQGMTNPRTKVPGIATDAVRRSRWKVVCFVLIACALLLALPFVPFLGIAIDAYNSKRERDRLLHETDHQALLTASRALMRDYAGQDIADPAGDPRVPPIIRELGPSSMVISSQQLRTRKTIVS